MSKEKKGAAKKEFLKQEKRKWKKEQSDKIEERKRQTRAAKPQGDRTFGKRKEEEERTGKRSFSPRNDERPSGKRSFIGERNEKRSPGFKKPFADRERANSKNTSFTSSANDFTKPHPAPAKGKFDVKKVKPEQMPLNKYIAHGGICSRRDAVELIKGGKVKVNGELILEPGYKVAPTDTVSVAGRKIHPVNNLVYILLNKPKDYITTTDDPKQRKTVLDL